MGTVVRAPRPMPQRRSPPRCVRASRAASLLPSPPHGETCARGMRRRGHRTGAQRPRRCSPMTVGTCRHDETTTCSATESVPNNHITDHTRHHHVATICRCELLNVGDSRAVLASRPASVAETLPRVALSTTDHSPADTAEAERIRSGGGEVCCALGGEWRVKVQSTEGIFQVRPTYATPPGRETDPAGNPPCKLILLAFVCRSGVEVCALRGAGGRGARARRVGVARWRHHRCGRHLDLAARRRRTARRAPYLAFERLL
jgi:hypothetical protein